MRIAIFIKSTTFHSGYGGLETQNKFLCEGLAQRGHDVLVFAPQKELRCETKYDLGVKYHFLPCEFKLRGNSSTNWTKVSAKIFGQHHKEKNFDLVVSQSSAGIGIIENRSYFNVPIVSISHGTILGEFKTKFQSVSSPKEFLGLAKDALFVLKVFFGRQRKFIHGSSKIIAVSQAVKKALIDETYVSDQKVVVINNGLDPSLFNKSEENSGSKPTYPEILYVGQVAKSKGLLTLLNLALEEEFSQTKFNIFGDGDFYDELKKKVSALGISDRFILFGKKPYSELLSILKQHEDCIFCFPTKRYEGFPMVLVEALFLGFPIVAYNVGGVSDAIKNEETGFLIPSENYSLMKDKILFLLNNKEKRKEFSEKGKKFAYNDFTLDKMLDRYEEVFRQVIAEYENTQNCL